MCFTAGSTGLDQVRLDISPFNCTCRSERLRSAYRCTILLLGREQLVKTLVTGVELRCRYLGPNAQLDASNPWPRHHGHQMQCSDSLFRQHTNAEVRFFCLRGIRATVFACVYARYRVTNVIVDSQNFSSILQRYTKTAIHNRPPHRKQVGNTLPSHRRK